MVPVPLLFHARKSKVLIGELSGVVEKEVQGTSTADAVRLLASLVTPEDGFLRAKESGVPPYLNPGEVRELSASDRDRLLCQVYVQTFGERIGSSLSCHQCHTLFDFDFSLVQLVQSLNPAQAIHPGRDGLYKTKAGLPFRLPTGEEEAAFLSDSEREAALFQLGQRLITHPQDGNSPDKASSLLSRGAYEALEQQLEAVAPLCHIELKAPCPHCAAQNEVCFDIQHYLLRTLCLERSILMREIHYLASMYHWELSTILSLSRSDRKVLCACIESPANAVELG